MAHAALRLTPGVNQTETSALNQAGISQSNLIRFFPDPQVGGLCQKLGGWSRYFSNTIAAIVRALWAFEDTNNQSYLAVGTQNVGSTGSAQLSIISGGSQQIITPRSIVDNIAPVVSTTAGSSIVKIIDTTTMNLTNADTVYISTQISAGGLILFGLYAINPDGFIGTNTYHIQAVDVLGNPLPAPYSSSATVTISVATPAVVTWTGSNMQANQPVVFSTTGALPTPIVAGTTYYVSATGLTANLFEISATPGGAVINTSGSQSGVQTATSTATLPLFTTTSGKALTTVTLANHGYTAGSDFPVVVPTTVGGIPFFGNYPVISVTNASNFVINGSNSATSSTTGYLNGGNAQYIYSLGATPTVIGTGYGIGGYGRGGYGTGTSVVAPTGTAIAANDWTLDNFGEVLIACPVNSIDASSSATALFEPVYYWDPESGQPYAQVIPTAPVVNNGIFVAMPQRQIIAWGSSFTGISDPLLIRWCDVNNYDSWIAAVTNQAGSFRIAKGSRIVGAIQVPQQGLIWTDVGVWSMQYISQPLVYSFNEIGTGCGLIARKAAASYAGVVYWMGPSQFYTLGAATATGTGGVAPLPCPVWDVIFQDLDQSNLPKIRVAVNSLFNEIAWYYPTLSSGGEVAAYVKYNTVLGTWDYGVLGRSAWIDQSVLGPPIGADPSSLYIYQHETSPDADGMPMLPSFQTGYFALSEADVKTFVDQVWPDMKWGLYGGSQNATVMITFYVVDYPGDTPRVYGPYSVTQATKYFRPRFRGKLVSIGLASNDIGSFWRLGLIRYQLAADGKYY